MSTSVLNSPVLVLNKHWSSIRIETVKDGLMKAFTGGAKLMDEETSILYTWEDWFKQFSFDFNDEVDDFGYEFIRASSALVRVPKIIVLTSYDKIPFTEIKLTRRNLLIRDKFRCFIPESLVLMSDLSFKRIDQIKIGDKILDAFGKEQFVEHIHKRKTGLNEKLLKFYKVGDGDPIICTKDHKILISNDFTNIEQIPASEIKDIKTAKKNADYLFELMLWKNRNDSNNIKDIDIADYIGSLKYARKFSEHIKNINSDIKINRKIHLDYDFGKLIGYFLSEGSISDNMKGFRFAFNISENDLINDVINLCKKYFGLNGVRNDYPEKHLSVIYFCSSVVKEFLRQWCYIDGDKRIIVKNASVEYLSGILYGIIMGDGYINEKNLKIEIMMSRENLIRDIHIVSNLLGIYPLLSKTGRRSDGRIYKSCIYIAEEYNKLNTRFNFGLKENTNSINRSYRYFENGKILSRTNKVEEIDYKGLVYDLQISGSHTYIVNFVAVHNCQYTGQRLTSRNATMDHIVPRSRGGKTEWSNVVICSFEANIKKGNKTLAEAGLKLLKKPTAPKWHPLYSYVIQNRPACWDKFIDTDKWNEIGYWDVELID